MRILIYGLNYAPELTGIGKYTGEMAAWLSARGHEVRVVCAPPYYPAWQVAEEYRDRPYRVERAPQLPTVFRAPLWVPRSPRGLNRVAHLVSFALGSLPVMVRQMFWRPELVFTVQPTFFCAPMALLTARMCGAQSWLHVQDLEVDAAFDLGMLTPNGPMHRAALRSERAVSSLFDRVSSISERMLERLQDKGVREQRTLLFPNWVDVDEIFPMERASDYRKELGLEGKIVLLYSGTMGAKQGLDALGPLADAIADDQRLHLLLCGDGGFRQQLERKMAGQANVTMLPLQPLGRLNELLNVADIHLLPQRADAADLVMPSKLTGMLASGRPVVATAEPESQVWKVVEGRGLAVPPADSAALEGAVRALAADAALRQNMGAAARQHAVESLGREFILAQFERDAEVLVKAARTR